LLPSSKSPVESLTIKRDRRSVLLADEINYCLLIFRSAKTLSIACYSPFRLFGPADSLRGLRIPPSEARLSSQAFSATGSNL
jgi:hypothetical protein